MLKFLTRVKNWFLNLFRSKPEKEVKATHEPKDVEVVVEEPDEETYEMFFMLSKSLSVLFKMRNILADQNIRYGFAVQRKFAALSSFLYRAYYQTSRALNKTEIYQVAQHLMEFQEINELEAYPVRCPEVDNIISLIIVEISEFFLNNPYVPERGIDSVYISKEPGREGIHGC